MYLPVPLFGYLCDRYTPSPLALLSGLVFGGGYLLAAFAYRSGPLPEAGGEGWPPWVMVVAFVAIGTATSCMYLAAVTTCAKNFGRGKHKGIMLAVPIAGFGLSGMWQSQVATYLLCERREDGSRGDVDVFRYFLFLALFLFCLGVIGTFGLRIVDEEEDQYIDEAVEELERSGLLEESEFFRPRSEVQAAYGTFSDAADGDAPGPELSLTLSEEEREAARLEKEREEEERRKKNWLLNFETRLFLQDQTMWWLAVGFFLVTGPGEAYINNVSLLPTIPVDDKLIFLLVRHNHSDTHAGITPSQCSIFSRPALYTCDYNSAHVNYSPTADRISLGLLRAPGHSSVSGKHRKWPSLLAIRSDRKEAHPVATRLPSAFSPPPLPRLSPPLIPLTPPAPRSFTRNNRADRPRLRQRLFPRPHHHLCRMGS